MGREYRDESADGPVIAGILLAAGTGSRFDDGNKLLATVDGDPLIRRSTRTLVESNAEPIVAVLGHDAAGVRDALTDLPVESVENPDYREGQSTSGRRGIEAVADRADAAVIALGDMPFVEPASIDALIEAYAEDAGDVLAAAYDGERGNPVLFDSAYFDALTAIDGDVGGRHICRRDGVLVETGDPGVLRDVDRRADLEAADDMRRDS